MSDALAPTLQTLGRPEYPASLQWSQDNLLAVAAGAGVVVISPTNLCGPRGSTPNPEPNCSFMEVDAYPKEAGTSSSFTSTYLRTRGLYSARTSLLASSRIGIRSISWSPLGCDAPGNALLTTVTDNFQVRVHAPPVDCGTLWPAVVELTSRLKGALQSESWKSLDRLLASSDSPGSHLRLRGGASDADVGPDEGDANEHELSSAVHKFKAADLVEVATDEEGLQGCWFGASIAQVQHNFALVEYQELMDEDDTSQRLTEWFPLPDAKESDLQKLGSVHNAHIGPSFQIRPSPPPQIAVRGGPRAVHDQVDVWEEGGWWEGSVTQATKLRLKLQPSVNKTVLSARLQDARTGLLWTGQEWKQRESAQGKKAARKSRKRKAGEEDEAPAEKDAVPDKQKSEPYQLPEGFSAADLPPVDMTSNKTGRANLARAAAARFFDLRKQASGEQVPTYENYSHALHPGDDALALRVTTEYWAAYADAAAKHDIARADFVKAFRDKLRLSWDRVIDPQANYVFLDKRVRGAQANVDIRKLVQGESGQDDAHKDDTTQAANKAAAKPAGYEVLPDFDKSVLQVSEEDLSSKPIAQSILPHAFWLRWLHLRQQIPEGEEEQYTKGQHLRGMDAQNCDQVQAEMVAGFGDDMTRLGLKEKWLVTAGKQLIRKNVIQTQSMSGKQKREWSVQQEEQLRGLAKRRRSQASAPDEEGDAGTSGAAAAKGAKSAASTPPKAGYKLPADFDAAVLGQADFSSKQAAERSLPQLFLQRWLHLHAQGEGEHLAYKRGQHLRGVDAENADRVQVEMAAAFEEDMAKVKVTQKLLHTESKRLIRAELRTRGLLAEAPASLSKEPTPEVDEEPRAEGQPRARRRAAVHASASLRAGRDSPDTASSADEEFKAEDEPEPEAEEVYDIDPASGDELLEVKPPSVARAAKVVQRARDRTKFKGSARHRADTAVPLSLHPSTYTQRLGALAALQAAWSPVSCVQEPGKGKPGGRRFAVLAVGCKAGIVWLWRYWLPQYPDPSASLQPNSFELLGGFRAQRSWVTCLAWATPPLAQTPDPPPAHPTPVTDPSNQLLLFTGSSDGCVRLHSQSIDKLGRALSCSEAVPAEGPGAVSVKSPEAGSGTAGPVAGSQEASQGLLQADLMQLEKTLHGVDLLGVNCLSVTASKGGFHLLVAAGKAAGTLLTCSLTLSTPAAASQPAEVSCGPVHLQKAAHGSRQVTGLAWASAQLPLQSAPAKPSPQHGDDSKKGTSNGECLVGATPGLGATAHEGEERSCVPVVGPLLVTSGADGQIRLWEHACAGLLPRNCPAAWSSPSLEKDQAFQPLGVAVSANGLMLAVAVDNGTAASAAVHQGMIYQRLYNGNVILHSLAGPPPHPLDPTPTALAIAKHAVLQMQQPQTPHFPSQLWDLAQLLLQHCRGVVTAAAAAAEAAAAKAEADKAQARKGAPAEGQGSAPKGNGADSDEGEAEAEEVQQGADAACGQALLTLEQAIAQSDLIQEVLDALEQPWHQCQAAEAEQKGPLQVPQEAWQGLQCATALRRMLHPSKHMPKKAQARPAPPWQDMPSATVTVAAPPEATPTGAPQHVLDWDAAIERSDLQLLQLHLGSCLTAQAPSGGLLGEEEQRLSKLLMADWISMHSQEPWLQAGLLPLAQQTHKHHGIDATDSPPAREKSSWFNTDVGLLGSPLFSAQAVQASEVLPLELKRCAASLMLCETVHVWDCTLCSRRYRHMQGRTLCNGLPCCLYCGVQLGLPAPAQGLRPPAT